MREAAPVTSTCRLLEKSRHYPLGLGRPEDVAHAVVYLLADASRKVTGISLDLDGGLAWT